jgi:hypothetical protein
MKTQPINIDLSELPRKDWLFDTSYLLVFQLYKLFIKSVSNQQW